MPTLLSLEGLSKSFGSLLVTDNVTLSVTQGEAVGIIGPNGAGKSTLFNLISGDLRPDVGGVFFDGAEITSVSAFGRSRLGIGRSYQIPQPFEDMTVLENLLVGAFFGGRSRISRPHEYCDEILVNTGLMPKARVRAGTLTLLERKRLELARSLAISPKLLLLDEIAGGLTDPEAEELLELIHTINETGVTVIWIEHVLHSLLPAISRLLVLNFGRLIADGAPAEIMANAEVRAMYLGLDKEHSK
jgi:branched-chain amino acid transport system ATP-binding protein